MKQALLLFAVFVVAFGATLLLSREVFETKPLVDESRTAGSEAQSDAELSAKRRAEIQRTMIPKDMPAPGTETAVEAGASASPELGEIEGVAKTDDGLEPRNLKVLVFPQTAEPQQLGGGRFRIPDLEPGDYQVGVAADGYVARPGTLVTVKAGTKLAIELGLERGLELRGMVIEDVDQRPIQGAVIDFNGLAQATSDAFGGFTTGVVPEKALEVVTITHEDFDRNRIVHPVVPDPNAIVFAVSRGGGTVTGRVIAASDEKAPGHFQVRLWRAVMPGHEELRRELVVRDASTFEIRGVFNGAHVLEVAFPGTSLATRRIELDLAGAPTRHVDVDLNQGGRIEGVLTAIPQLVSGQTVTLVDTGNHPLGQTITDAEGRFRFEHVSGGDYAVKVQARIPPLHSESFKVEDGKIARISVDGHTGRVK